MPTKTFCLKQIWSKPSNLKSGQLNNQEISTILPN